MKKYLLLILIFFTTLFTTIAQKPNKNLKKYKYVTARSGLNFRQKPNGKILGKIKFRTKVEYLYSTDKLQKIKDDNQEIEGVWIAVKHKKRKVFVFDYFLNDEKPPIDLFYVEEYYSHMTSKKMDIRQAFVNISEIFQIPPNFLKKQDLKKDTIHLNKLQKKILLKKIGYSNKDYIYIYSIKTGLVKKHSVKDLPMMACINIYSKISEEYREQQPDYEIYDYQFGFNFSKLNDGGLTMIGRKNPFVEKGLKPLIFEKIKQKDMGRIINKKLITGWEINKKKPLYKFKYKQFDIFNKGYGRPFIIDRNTKIGYSYIEQRNEGVGGNPIRIKGKKACCSNYHQYIGKLFKNTGVIFFGFNTYSFDCESITVVDKKEKPIRIMCDNRH